MVVKDEDEKVASFLCRKDGTVCGICGEATEIGTEIYPMTGMKKWCHVSCYVLAKTRGLSIAEVEERPLCKHFVRKGSCRYGDKCFFSHDEKRAAKKRATLPAARRAWGGKRRIVKNESRAAVLRRFLIDTFGIEKLREGVVDVAGGKGDLAFQLVNLNSVPATVMDPRNLQLRKFARCLTRGMYHRNRIFCTPKYVQEKFGGMPHSPRHLSLCLDYKLMTLLGVRFYPYSSYSRAMRKWKCPESMVKKDLGEAFAQATEMRWTKKGLHEDGMDMEQFSEFLLEDNGDEEDLEVNPDVGENVRANEACYDTLDGKPVEIRDFDDVMHTLTSAGVIAGMHADQATEPIVDYALKSGKGFAVVCCCVYAKSFPGRKLKESGDSVGSTEEFVRYLVEKDPSRVRTAKLDFEGKNTVVYGLESPYCPCTLQTNS